METLGTQRRVGDTDAGAGQDTSDQQLRDTVLLLVEDDLGDQQLFLSQLRAGGLQPTVIRAGTLSAAVRHLEDDDVDMVLLDLGLPDAQGLQTVERVAQVATDIPVVVLTGHGDDPELALAALREGAHDYLVKGETGASELARAIRYALERHDLQERSSAQLLHQAALHQLEIAGSAAADLQGFVQSAASALRVGLGATSVSLQLDGVSLLGAAAATAARQPPRRPGARPPLRHGAAVELELRGDQGRLGMLTITGCPAEGPTPDQQRFLATASAAIVARTERIVESAALTARTRQLDTVQQAAQQLQRLRAPQEAVGTVADLLAAGVRDLHHVGVRVEVEGEVAARGLEDLEIGMLLEVPVTVRGENVGTVRLLHDQEDGWGPEERTMLQGVAAQLGTWWALARADQEHRRDLDRIAQLMETAPVGLALADADGVIRFANAAALELVGAATVEDFPWRFDQDGAGALPPPLLAVARVRGGAGPVRDVHVALHLADGTQRVLAVNASPLAAGPDGHGMALSLSDITAEQRRAVLLESALDREQRAAEELRNVSELKDGFLRALSHELRTPLAVIVGFTETLRDHSHELDTAQGSDMLERLSVNAQRLGLLLEDLLDVGRITAGVRTSPDVAEHDVAEIVANIVELLPTGEHHIELDLLPTPARIDRPKVERIVHNLVGNAIRHTPPGTAVRIRTRPADPGALLTVEDDGPGIPAADRTRMFEPFVQGRQANASANPGTGVGLSLVRQFVELHGGTVTLSDSDAGGARFLVTLPDA